MIPQKGTNFKPISELIHYSDKELWFCTGVVFSPETENNHFEGCPPYIHLGSVNCDEDDVFFEVPEIVAYYAKTHPCYTMAGIKGHIKQGEREMALKIKRLLDL